jgi:spore coat protein H
MLTAGWLPAAMKKSAAADQAEADEFFSRGTPFGLSIEIPAASIESLHKDQRRYTRATVREGGRVYTNVAVHLKGSAGSFRQVEDRPGLTLNFDMYELGNPRFHGLKKVHLNNSVQDPTYLSEMICGEMFRQAGVPAARAAHALVELNGRKLGLYVMLESMNRPFLARYFTNTTGNLYGQAGGCEINDENFARMEGSRPLTREDLKELAKAAQEKDATRRQALLEQKLDVERFLSFMAMEVLLCHWDGYTFACHNYRVYQDVDTRRMVFFPHDLDQLMQDPNVGLVPGTSALIGQAVLSTPVLRHRYRQRVNFLATNLFVVPVLTNEVDAALTRLLPALKAYNADLAREVQNQAAGLKSRFINRGESLEQQCARLAAAKAPKFTNNLALLSGWRAEVGRGGARVEERRDPEGKETLWIEATNQSSASWRTRVVLEGGSYRFEGWARAAGVQAIKDQRGEGAGLRISGSQEPRPNKLLADADWQRLGYPFEVAGPSDDVELVCELRANKGQVWFDRSSLRLVRVK